MHLDDQCVGVFQLGLKCYNITCGWDEAENHISVQQSYSFRMIHSRKLTKSTFAQSEGFSKATTPTEHVP